VQQSSKQAQIAGNRRAASQQRKDPLVNLHIHAVNPVVVGNNKVSKLKVLMGERLERPVKRTDHQIERFKRVALKSRKFVFVCHHSRHISSDAGPTRPHRMPLIAQS
jgi:hypothetical protein